MSTSRYNRSSTLTKDGKLFKPCSTAVSKIRNGVQTGIIEVTTRTLRQGVRLDTVSADVYGSPKLWWIIAAASGIGWGCQVPAGVVLSVPTDIKAILRMIS